VCTCLYEEGVGVVAGGATAPDEVDILSKKN
jgi:hypothetical protein